MVMVIIYISHYKEKELMVMVISLIKFRQWLISLRFDSVRRELSCGFFFLKKEGTFLNLFVDKIYREIKLLQLYVLVRRRILLLNERRYL